mgnify:CR=1 FL=1
MLSFFFLVDDDVFATMRQALPPTVNPKVFDEIGDVMWPEVELARAKAYGQRPAIVALHNELSTLPRCAKHGTVSVMF